MVQVAKNVSYNEYTERFDLKNDAGELILSSKTMSDCHGKGKELNLDTSFIPVTIERNKISFVGGKFNVVREGAKEGDIFVRTDLLSALKYALK